MGVGDKLGEKIEGWREITAQMEAEYAAPKRGAHNQTVSVVMPVYNAAETLQDSVLSVRRQSYADLELLLIDDGSTDGSGDICDHLAENDARIRVIHTSNQGVSAARNRGMEEAVGSFLMFVDADDALKPDAIRVLMDAEQAAKTDLVCARYETVSTNAAQGMLVTQGPDYTGGSTQTLSGFAYIDHCILEKDTHVWGKLFFLPAIRELRFRDGLTIGEDMLFLTDAALLYGSRLRITVLPDVIYEYKERADSAMNRPYTASFDDNLTCWELCEERLAPYTLQLSPYALTNLHVIRIVNALLVAGKIAQLPEEAWAEHRDTLQRVKEIVRWNRGQQGVFAALPFKDKARVLYFLQNETGYLRSYARHKEKTV